MLYQWVLYVHISAALLFFLCHGVSMAVALNIQREQEHERMRAMLQLSNGSPLFGMTWLMFLVMAGSGVGLGFLGRWWGAGWIWASVGILLIVVVAAAVFGSGYLNRLREALGLPSYSNPEPEAQQEPIQIPESLRRSRHPLILLGIGVGGTLVITWLMMFKPF